MAVTVCAICSTQPVNQIKLTEVTSLGLWFKTKRLNTVLCSKCAERTYFEYQSQSMRLGWWGIPAVAVTLVAVLGNQSSIRKHRRLLPYVANGNERTNRQLQEIRKDKLAVLSTAAAATITAITLTVSLSSLMPPAEAKPNPYGSKLGRCVATFDTANPVVDRYVECKYKHDWQIFGSTNSKSNVFDDNVVFKEADDFCYSQSQLINWSAFGKQEEAAKIITLSPDELSWRLGERSIVCMVGGKGLQITNSAVQIPKASPTKIGEIHDRL